MSDINLSLKNIKLELPWKLKLTLKGFRQKSEILKNVTLTAKKGEIVALVGRNGSGKSTLFRVISGIYQPTSGTVFLPGTVSVMALSMGFMPPLSGRENVILQGLIAGMNMSEAKKAAQDVLDHLHDTQLGREGRYEMPYHTYSAGMKAMIASSSALLKNSDVYLVDEVFGVGDEIYRETLANELKKRAAEGASVIVVSHDTAVLEKLCNRAILLDQGTIIDENMNVQSALLHIKENNKCR